MGSRRHRILLVEDDEDIAIGMEDQLEGMGYDCVHVTNQVDAIAEIEKGNICLVLLDLEIPTTRNGVKAETTTGISTLKRIRKLHPERTSGDMSGGDPKPRLQVLVLSGHVRARSTTAKLFQMGAQDVLVKPLSDNDQPFDEILSKALRAAERVKHSSCQDTEDAARHRSSTGYPSEAEHRSLVDTSMLVIDLKKMVTYFNSKEIPSDKTEGLVHLQPQQMMIFGITAAARKPPHRMHQVDLLAALNEINKVKDSCPPKLDTAAKKIRASLRSVSPQSQHKAIGAMIKVRRDELIIDMPGTIEVLGYLG